MKEMILDYKFIVILICIHISNSFLPSVHKGNLIKSIMTTILSFGVFFILDLTGKKVKN